MEIIRNLARRKLRNFLTISGIVIGVLALVTMGSMAEKFNALLAGGPPTSVRTCRWPTSPPVRRGSGAR